MTPRRNFVSAYNLAIYNTLAQGRSVIARRNLFLFIQLGWIYTYPETMLYPYCISTDEIQRISKSLEIDWV
jgi:hypothetical protein